MGRDCVSRVQTKTMILRGMDAPFISYAETSFNYLVAGVIIGGVVGAISEYFLFKKKGLLNKPEIQTFHLDKKEVEPMRVKGGGENIKKLAELRDSRILTEEEFQTKKKEMLNRL